MVSELDEAPVDVHLPTLAAHVPTTHPACEYILLFSCCKVLVAAVEVFLCTEAFVATDERSRPNQVSQWQTKDSKLYYHAYLRALECVW